MSRWLVSLWYARQEGILVRALLWPLWVLSLLVRWSARTRRERWSRPGKQAKVDAKVISVGNLAVGGAGKTPVTIHLANLLAEAGRHPAVLSRGWGRDNPAQSLVVSDGRSILAEVRESGDEPALIARTCRNVPVLVGPDRATLARMAIERFGARTLLLDDGLQHLRLARDLDVVVLDASNPFGNGHLLPRGPLREGPETLSNAGLVWLAKVDQAGRGEVDALQTEVRRHTQAPIVQSAYRVADVLDDGGRSLGPESLAGKRVLLMAGIARPQSFRRTLEKLGATVEVERLLPDHGWFRPMDVEDAKLIAQRRKLDAIALTEKDAVRLPDSVSKGPFAVVRIETEVVSGAQALASLL